MKKEEKEYSSHFDEDLKFGEAGQNWLLWLSDDAQVEVKTERDKWYDTDNIFIEFEYRGNPSGISTTTATYWAHIFYKEGMNCGVLVLRTSVLKYNLKRMYEEDSSGIKIVSGGDDKASKGFLVPLKALSGLMRLGLM